VLNGVSSSGKTTLAEALQDTLGDTWLIFGIDTLLSALPLALLEIHPDAAIGAHPREHHVREGGIAFDQDGTITVGAEFRRLESAWLKGVAAVVDSGVRLILDEVFLDGVLSQDRLGHALAGHRIAWFGVICDDDVAARRERERGDRVVGASQKQSVLVHEGVHYDLVVDTTVSTPQEVARQIVDHLLASTP